MALRTPAMTARSEDTHSPAVLITGGAGFLGRALIRELLDPACALCPSTVRVLDTVAPEPVDDPRCEYVAGDIRSRERIEEAVDGMDVVFHMAAIVDWGTHPREDVFAVNVDGTQRVIDACRTAGVRALVYTSSLDAIATGTPIRDADERTPYPTRWPNAYCESKARAEQLALEADGDTMRTVSLRPCDIYGEADPYHVSSLVKMAQGWPYVRIGDGSAECQHIYAGNVAHAQVCAAVSMLQGNASCCGKPYFLTDSPPSNFFVFFDEIVRRAGCAIRPRNVWIPRALMYAAGSLAEALAWLVRPVVRWNPKVSRFAVDYTCNDFTLNGDAARRDFGFTPKYTTEEAIARTAEWFRINGPVEPGHQARGRVSPSPR